MKLLHYYTGITISLFIGMHILNHFMIFHSERMHIQFMNRMRKIYRNPVIETILLLAILTQIITGPILIIAKWNKATEFFDWLQIFSGLYLALFLANHVKAVMMGRHKLHLDTNLYYGAGVMNMWPHKLFFIPYYSLAIFSFFSHVGSIHRFKIEGFVGAAAAKTQGYIIIATGAIATSILIARLSHLKDFHVDTIRATAKHENI